MPRSNVKPTDVHRVFLFAGVDGEILDHIVTATHRIALAAGESLFHVGDAVTHFYYVESGRIQLSRSSSAGDEKIIAVIGPGETFAEALMFSAQTDGYPVDARAIAPTSLLCFAATAVRSLLAQSPETCFRMMSSMSRRLRELVLQIDEITLHNGTYRLVAYLIRQLPPEPEHARDIQLTLPKNIIASRLSIQPETFSRILADLRRADLLLTDGPNIVLKDVSGLRRLLEE